MNTKFIQVCLSLLLLILAGWHAAGELTLTHDPGNATLTSGPQRLTMTKTQDVFEMTLSFKQQDEWTTVFDNARPIISGSSFDLRPTAYEVIENTPERATLRFSGNHSNPGYPWELRIEATAADPWFKFTITCHLDEPLALNGLEPVTALWTPRAGVAVQVDQGPDSIYGDAGIPHGFGFPAAYWWDGGIETLMFFDMTPMTWMSRDGIWRFHDVRIQTRVENDQTGIGMHLKKRSGNTIPAGDMVIPFYLCLRPREEQPAKIDALGELITTFAPLHPATSPWPETVPPGGELTWTYFAKRAIENLMRDGETMATIEAPWADEPLNLVPPQEKMIVHPGRVASTPEQARTEWDFSTVNNHLTPWILYARLNNDDALYQTALAKANALPRFYDPKSGLIRHGTRQPDHVGDKEMTWQNLFFHIECFRAANALCRKDLNPVLLGRTIMSVNRMRLLAVNTNYVFPQWFDPYTLQPIVQNDLPQLGVVYEPWQAGAFAYAFLQRLRQTGDYQGHFGSTDCIMGLSLIFNGMTYTVENEVYKKTYNDPVDFPITELFGNAYGSVAFLRDNDENLQKFSINTLYTLLRLTPWCEDETDSLSKQLKSAGLFYPHCGAASFCPWETVEANLCLAKYITIKKNSPLKPLLLKLLNLNRINSFYFFPATYHADLRNRDGRSAEQVDDFFPVEAFYTLENQEGHRGPAAAYMASLALWNYWLYEGMAEASPRDVMILNTQYFDEEPCNLLDRNLVAYNPTSEPVTATVRFKNLPAGDYVLMINNNNKQSMPAESLLNGVEIKLLPLECAYIILHPGKTINYRENDKLFSGDKCNANLIHAYDVFHDIYPHMTNEDIMQCKNMINNYYLTEKSHTADSNKPFNFEELKLHLRKTGKQMGWIGLYNSELYNWLNSIDSRLNNNTISEEEVMREAELRTVVIPVYAKPDKKSASLGTIFTRIDGGIVKTYFQPYGTQEMNEFKPDICDTDWGYGEWCHQSFLERQGNWFLLPKRPLPEAGWVCAEDYDFTPHLIFPEIGGIYYWNKQDIVLIAGDITNGYIVRPEQLMDYNCSSDYEPFAPYTPQTLTWNDLHDADGHLMLDICYKRGC